MLAARKNIEFEAKNEPEYFITMSKINNFTKSAMRSVKKNIIGKEICFFVFFF